MSCVLGLPLRIDNIHCFGRVCVRVERVIINGISAWGVWRATAEPSWTARGRGKPYTVMRSGVCVCVCAAERASTVFRLEKRGGCE